jgi:hypothetical protein
LRAALQIEITDEPTPVVVHRFRNFGQDVYRQLRDICAVSIEEIDRATTSFVLREIRTRDLPKVRKLLLREIKRHNFDSSARVVPG